MRPNSEERYQRWLPLPPRSPVYRLGIARYVDAARGCEFGREDARHIY